MRKRRKINEITGFFRRFFGRSTSEKPSKTAQQAPTSAQKATTPAEPPVDFSQKIVDRIKKAESMKLALSAEPSSQGSGKSFILYRPDAMVRDFMNFATSGDSSSITVEKIIDLVQKSTSDAVIGMIDLVDPGSDDGPCNNAYIVKFSAAGEGFGPMLYDVAMSLSGGRPITSDRHAVSSLATKIYKGMHKRGDIEKTEFSDVKDEENEDDPARCELWGNIWPDRHFLDYSFKKTSSLDANELMKNHQRMLIAYNDMMKVVLSGEKSQSIDAKELINTALTNAATDFFENEYYKLTAVQKGFKSDYVMYPNEYKESIERAVFRRLLEYSRKTRR